MALRCWRQIVLNAIIDESIMFFKGLKDSAVGGLDAHYKISKLCFCASVNFGLRLLHVNGRSKV